MSEIDGTDIAELILLARTGRDMIEKIGYGGRLQQKWTFIERREKGVRRDDFIREEWRDVPTVAA